MCNLLSLSRSVGIIYTGDRKVAKPYENCPHDLAQAGIMVDKTMKLDLGGEDKIL